MGKNRLIPFGDDDAEFLADHARMKADLREDGPAVDLELLESYVDGALGQAERRVVIGYVTTYRNWADALLRLETAVPPKDAQGPPVDEEQMTLYLAGRLTVAEEVPIRRNIRLFRNWYEAACRNH